VFENWVLRRKFGPKRDDVTGGWRKLHNEEVNDVYFSPNIIQAVRSRRMRCTGHMAHAVERRGAYRVLVRRPEGKRPLRRPRRRWKNNIKLYLQEVGWGDMDWMYLAEVRDRWRAIVNAVMNLRVP
jgi:hypothetical protein